jgi:hypothetical protein
MPAPKRSPLVTSVTALRGMAAGITMLSLAGMTAYAGGHLHNPSAPLQPAVAAAAPASAAPAARRRDDDHERTSRLVLTPTVPTTTSTRAVTTTHHS